MLLLKMHALSYYVLHQRGSVAIALRNKDRSLTTLPDLLTSLCLLALCVLRVTLLAACGEPQFALASLVDMQRNLLTIAIVKRRPSMVE